MFISKKHLSRRTVLKGVGATVALPLLDAMIPAGTALAVDVADFTVPLPILRQSTEREQIDVVASLDDASGRVLATARITPGASSARVKPGLTTLSRSVISSGVLSLMVAGLAEVVNSQSSAIAPPH